MDNIDLDDFEDFEEIEIEIENLDVFEDFNDFFKITVEEVEGPMYPINENGIGIIPLGTTYIKDRSFRGCKKLTNIVIPVSVRTIGHNAFEGCTGLTSIVIPDSVKEIGRSAFMGCTGLTSIVIPDSVEWIGFNVFEGCNSLESIYCHADDPEQIIIENRILVRKDDEKKETIGIEYLGGYQATLYVHASEGVVNAYKRHRVWNKFADIKPFKNYR